MCQTCKCMGAGSFARHAVVICQIVIQKSMHAVQSYGRDTKQNLETRTDQTYRRVILICPRYFGSISSDIVLIWWNSFATVTICIYLGNIDIPTWEGCCRLSCSQNFLFVSLFTVKRLIYSNLCIKFVLERKYIFTIITVPTYAKALLYLPLNFSTSKRTLKSMSIVNCFLPKLLSCYTFKQHEKQSKLIEFDYR